MHALTTPSTTAPCDPGQPWPMGASCMVQQGQEGVNFAVYSRHAHRIEVCLYDPQGSRETARMALPVCTNGVWHGFAAGLQAGQLYGLRAHGPYQPELGHRFNPAKLLLDPFARAMVGDLQRLSLERDYLGAYPDLADNAAVIPKAQVLNLDAERQAGAAITPCPPVPLEHAVLYEVHVKGQTQRHPGVPAALRGSYAGLCSAPLLAHYKHLGITTLCLLPVHLFITETHLLHKGLRNYWGYNTLGYFIPQPSYASGQYPDDRTEFRYMVDQLHRNGLEVVLDVVFNHSAESDAVGPTLSWRGLDNASWYALDRSTGNNLNFSGCGNSFNLGHSCSVQMVMDSLRWWVQAFGVDGFRFDLATALGRDPFFHHNFHPMSALLTAIGQDPVLARVRCIAEPWDVAPGGYKLGQFPAGWLEWNDRFRDTSRAFWLGHACTRGELARRLTGSSDYFEHDGRGPLSSVNLITAHDGMTLADLTSYSHKHNTANGENDRDGHHHDFSANAGVEGPTQQASVQLVREQWRRALLATLLCSQGTPQLLAGDELGHSQGGNNNAYCQDNVTTWLNWIEADHALTEFVAALVHLRRKHQALRFSRWFTGSTLIAPSEPEVPPENLEMGVDISWRNPDGTPLTAIDWEDPQSRSLAVMIEVANTGQTPTERWLLMFHAAHTALSFALPPGRWHHVLDSAQALVLPQEKWELAPSCSDTMTLSPRTVSGLVQTWEAL